MALTAVDKVMREHADKANQIVRDGTWVEDTPMGLFYYLIEDYKRAVEEDKAWDEHERKRADEIGPNKKFGSEFDYLVNSELI